MKTQDEVYHEYANAPGEYRARASNIFCEDNKIYSYGHHYELCRKVETKNFYYFLINSDRNYSVTTRSHWDNLRRAIPRVLNGKHTKVLYITSNAYLSLNFKHFADRMEFYAEKAKRGRARKSEYLYSVILHYERYQNYKNYLKETKTAYDLRKCFHTRRIRKLYSQLQNQLNNLEQLETERKEKVNLRLKENYTKWLNGGYGENGVDVKHSYGFRALNDSHDCLRYNARDNTIETSQGVRIDLNTHTRILIESLHRKTNLENDVVGKRYQILKCDYDKNFIEIGCHKLKISDILALNIPPMVSA